MRTIKIKDIEIGKGTPKIIIPLVGQSEVALFNEINFLIQNKIKYDVIEWRVDYLQHSLQHTDIDFIKTIAQKIREHLFNTPILFTCRTAKEGGEYTISIDDYVALNCHMIKSGLIDLIDIELFTGDNAVKTIIDTAHQYNIFVVASNHDFKQTPPKAEIVARLQKMQLLGADIPKIAVMPNSPQDVLTLLDATTEMVQYHADRPIITMSMGQLGIISRISGETFGSSMTFGSAKQASAPGQLEAKSLYTILQSLHHNENNLLK